MSEIKVNSIKGVGASDAAITINNTDGTCSANLSNRQGKNLVINGAFLVSQRGVSSTTNGYGTVDRFKVNYGGTTVAPTHSQVDVASGTTPYSLGFRKALRVTNADQSSGAGAGDSTQIQTRIEAQNIANSGWNYTSTSSFITFSFWVKSSVAQNFYGYIIADDGTDQNYSFETGSLSADTWTKVTKTIPGNSNLQFDSNNGVGFKIHITPFLGTDFTNSSVSLNSWYAYSSGIRTPDHTSTWYTTNNATFEITGVQLEVGSVATDFEHEPFETTLHKCQRYYHVIFDATQQSETYWQQAYYYNTSTLAFIKVMNPEMRATPSLECTSTSGVYRAYRNGSYNSINSFSISHSSKRSARIYTTGSFGSVSGFGAGLYVSSNGTNEMIALSAEL